MPTTASDQWTDEQAAAFKAAVIAKAPQPEPDALEKANADRTQSHGVISDSTVADWTRMIGDPTYPIAHRQMLFATATAAMKRIGRKFDVPAPVEVKS